MTQYTSLKQSQSKDSSFQQKVSRHHKKDLQLLWFGKMAVWYHYWRTRCLIGGRPPGGGHLSAMTHTLECKNQSKTTQNILCIQMLQLLRERLKLCLPENTKTTIWIHCTFQKFDFYPIRGRAQLQRAQDRGYFSPRLLEFQYPNRPINQYPDGRRKI